MSETIFIGSDHAGVLLKAALIAQLADLRWEDLGTHSEAAVDYPDIASRLVKAMLTNKLSVGVLICGTGVGMSIAANRHPLIRAAHASDPVTARLAREHNHANVLCLGSRIVARELAADIVRAWLDAKPSTDPRHQQRIDQLSKGP